MKTISQTYHINAPVEKVWHALTNSKDIDSWGGGSAKMDDKVGTKFSLWDGSIWGKNIEVKENGKLVQEWFSENEIVDKPSIVTFVLSKEEKGTKLDLIHKDVPDGAVKDIDDGWKSYYLEPLKEFVEKN